MSEPKTPQSPPPSTPVPSSTSMEPDLPLAPGDATIYIAPGMQTVMFTELLRSAGIMRGQAEWAQEVDTKIADLQRQIDELKSGAGAEPAAAATTVHRPQRTTR